jgi:hypothetical protein
MTIAQPEAVWPQVSVGPFSGPLGRFGGWRALGLIGIGRGGAIRPVGQMLSLGMRVSSNANSA